VVADRGEAVTAKKVTVNGADRVTPLKPLTFLAGGQEGQQGQEGHRVSTVERVTPLTPWSAGSPPLNRIRHTPTRWSPSRRQVLAGYTHPDDNIVVEGQAPTARGRLEARGVLSPTIAQLAAELGVSGGDIDLLAALFPDAAVEATS
jgi:hypothetical protein